MMPAISRAVVVALPFLLWACGSDEEQSGVPGSEIAPREPEVRSVTSAEAVADADSIRASVSVTTAEGLDVSLWASQKLLGDPVGIHMEDDGRALVTVTTRSWGSEIDIRDAPSHWLTETIKLTSVEERREFLRRELAPELSHQNTWIPDYNQDGSHDWRDLAVNQEEAWWIEDSSGDGLADRASLFIRDFNDEVTDVLGAVTRHNGDVFLGVGPDMWRVQDRSGDGIADWKESISHGYNLHIGFSGHGMSGATVGPDGRIYWGIGDMGFDVVDRDGQRWSHPYQGAILRSEPDGTGFEVFASGLRNTHVFVFDEYGNLITVDNDGDHAGEFERLVYLINGSDSGWRTNWQFGKYSDPENNSYHVWMDEGYYQPRFDDQAAHLLPPIARYHSGPAGMAYNPGTALDDSWRNHFFVMSFRGSPANSAIYAFTLEEDGAGFELATDQEVLRGLLPVGIEFGPDGVLYLTDWVTGWTPIGEGRMWKLDSTVETWSEGRLETQRLLGEGFAERSVSQLSDLLGHDDMRVRQRSQFELVARGELEALRSAVDPSRTQLARIHGIWGLAQAGRRDAEAVAPLISFLDDPDPEIRAQSARMLGDVRYEAAGSAIVPLVEDDHPRVRLFAAEALGRMEYSRGFAAILRMLSENDDEDVLLRHAGAIALSRMQTPRNIGALSRHPSRAIRIAAVVALRRMEAPEVARFLGDDDEYIVTNAARAIGDDAMIEEALPALAEMLDQDRFVNEPLIRRAINANLYVGDQQSADRLVAFALRDVASEVLRVEALETLVGWAGSSEFDRVDGRYRGRVENDRALARAALDPLVDELAASRSEAFTIATIRVMSRLEVTSATPAIRAVFEEDRGTEVRIAALTALRDLDDPEMGEVVQQALEGDEPSVRMVALGIMGELELSGELAVPLLASVLEEGDVVERQTAYAILGGMTTEASYRLLESELDRLMAGELPREVELDLVLAAEEAGTAGLDERLAQLREGRPQDEPMALFSESVWGGDSADGRRIFVQHQTAQCSRCHAVGGGSADVGPNLAGVGSRLSREQLLESLVDPAARLAPGYDTGGVSAMPAMGSILTRTELRDLVEYLSTL